MSKKQKKVNVRKLFLERIKREGREQEYKEVYKEEKAKDGHHYNSQYRTMVRMGYKDPADEEQQYADFMRWGAGYAMEREKHRQMEELREERDKCDVIADLNGYDISTSDLPEEVAFAFHNLHKMPDPTNPKKWKIWPENAPNPGAWNLLMWAATDQKSFMQMVLKELMRTPENKTEEGAEQTAATVDEIERLLEQIG